jgi:predicted ABC-type transport system involved in lysophospholipase L1 biosynthesis ATPase subunit
MVTHNPETAARAQRQVELFDGQIVADSAAPRELAAVG